MTQGPNWFIGFPLDDAWVAEAIDGIPDGLRTFHGEDIHVTIAFLGSCGTERAYDAWRWLTGEELDGAGSAVRTAGTSAPPAAANLGPAFDLTLGGLAPFGDPARPSALSAVPTQAGDESQRRIEALRDPLRQAAGLPTDGRPVRPHATVARIRRRETDEARAAAVAWALAKPPLNVTLRVDRIALYTWTDDRARQLYRIVESVRLG